MVSLKSQHVGFNYRLQIYLQYTCKTHFVCVNSVVLLFYCNPFLFYTLSFSFVINFLNVPEIHVFCTDFVLLLRGGSHDIFFIMAFMSRVFPDLKAMHCLDKIILF